MAQRFIKNRVEFPPGQKEKFLENCQKVLRLNTVNFARYLKIHARTLADWKRGKYLIPVKTFDLLRRKTNVPVNKVSVRNKLHDVQEAARLGGEAIIIKYGRIPVNSKFCMQKWKTWWNDKGRFLRQPALARKSIKLPPYGDLLAEFVGILMGDGGITERQIMITLNRHDDYRYGIFVKKTMKKLFNVIPSVRMVENVQKIYISRTNLVDFCKKIGLKVGNKIKQGLDIPDWVWQKDSFQKACVRGLMDTDGCVGIHRYIVKKKAYCYKKLVFTSASPPLVKSVMDILRKFNFNPRLARDGRKVWLDDSGKVREYMSVIGTSNPKHEKRFRLHGEVPKWLKGRVC